MIAPRLIVVTDPAFAPDATVRAIGAALAAVPPGTIAVQLRDRAARPMELARELRALTRAHGAKLIVNRDVVLAREIGADGAHFGAGEVPDGVRALLGAGAWITVAAHSDEEVRDALRRDADAVLVSPIFASPGKGAPRGVDALRRARVIAPDHAIYALGGVDASNVPACIDAGATGIAVIRAILAASDPGAAATALTVGSTRRS